MISNASFRQDNIETRVLTGFHRHLVSAGTQTIFDIAVLAAAFVVAYLLRFEFQIPRNYWHQVMVQAPFVVLLQFLALTLAGGRAFIWRYTDMAHIKSFFMPP